MQGNERGGPSSVGRRDWNPRPRRASSGSSAVRSVPRASIHSSPRAVLLPGEIGVPAAGVEQRAGGAGHCRLVPGLWLVAVPRAGFARCTARRCHAGRPAGRPRQAGLGPGSALPSATPSGRDEAALRPSTVRVSRSLHLHLRDRVAPVVGLTDAAPAAGDGRIAIAEVDEPEVHVGNQLALRTAAGAPHGAPRTLAAISRAPSRSGIARPRGSHQAETNLPFTHVGSACTSRRRLEHRDRVHEPARVYPRIDRGAAASVVDVVRPTVVPARARRAAPRGDWRWWRGEPNLGLGVPDDRRDVCCSAVPPLRCGWWGQLPGRPSRAVPVFMGTGLDAGQGALPARGRRLSRAVLGLCGQVRIWELSPTIADSSTALMTTPSIGAAPR